MATKKKQASGGLQGSASPFPQASGAIQGSYPWDMTLPFNQTPQAGPQPWDTLYDSRVGNLNQSWQDYSGPGGTYDQSAQSITSSFGFNQKGEVDPSNPFSRAALLQQHYANSQRGDSNSFAARGQRNSGAYQNAINSRTNTYNQNYNALALEAQNAWNQLSQQRLGMQRQHEQGLTDAEAERLQTSLNAPPVDPGPSFMQVVAPYQQAGYKIDTRPNNDAGGNFIFIRQPNTHKLFKLYTNGNKVPA